MEATSTVNVPQQVTEELTQILSNLVLGDNEIRANAEKVVNERLSQTPEMYILALGQFACKGPDDIRSFSLILLRRLLFRSSSSSSSSTPSLTLYDHLSELSRLQLERLLLTSLIHEPIPHIKHKSADTISDLANASFHRGRPWPDLHHVVFSVLSSAADSSSRDCAFRVLERCQVLLTDTPPDVLANGLSDSTFDVRLQALKATITYLSLTGETLNASTASQLLTLSLSLVTSYQSSSYNLTKTLNALTQLASTHPFLFNPHLQSLLSILPPIILGSKDYDAGPTPTVARPFPLTPSGNRPSPNSPSPTTFVFPPPVNLLQSNSSQSPRSNNANGGSPSHGHGHAHHGSLSSLSLSPLTPTTPQSTNSSPSSNSTTNANPNAIPKSSTNTDDELEDARRAALEFMVTLSESKPSMVKRFNGWLAVIVRACLEGMGELDDDDDGEELRTWLEADPSNDPTDLNYPLIYTHSLDRLSLSYQSSSTNPILQYAFAYIPAMLASPDWRLRHAGLMAIASLGEGGAKGMRKELGRVVQLVTSMFNDAHPRVRYAACQCIGQLCTDLEESLQSQYTPQILSVLIPTLSAPEARVHAHAAAALINFCEGVEREMLIPYLDEIVGRLLRMLNGDVDNPADGKIGRGVEGEERKVRGYVQEQAVTTLAMVADASENTFAKHYPTIMPLLLNVLRNANSVEHKKLRWKAMECAGLIAIAVGRDIFRPDSTTLIELLMHIQNSPTDNNDTMLNHYLMATWAKICQAMGPEFEPYLPVVMPPLLQAASAKADVSVWDDETASKMDTSGWETLSLDGQHVGIKTSTIDEKCQAFETLVIYVSTLGSKFASYLTQALELALPALRFMFHDGVREACALVIPMLLICGKQSNTLTPQMVTASLTQIISVIETESDPSFLSSIYRCLYDTIRVIGSIEEIPASYVQSILAVTRTQLQVLAEKRRSRSINTGAGTGGRGSEGGRDSKDPNSNSNTGPSSNATIPSASTGGGDTDNDSLSDLALIEEIENFALEDMSKTLQYFEGSNEQAKALLIAVGSVRDLGSASSAGYEYSDEE